MYPPSKCQWFSKSELSFRTHLSLVLNKPSCLMSLHEALEIQQHISWPMLYHEKMLKECYVKNVALVFSKITGLYADLSWGS